MFLGHIPSTVLAWLTFRNYGFSDGADLFVFISGYNSASVFTRKMLERGFGLIAGLSNKLIAKEYDISPRTIEVYRANVMTKMQANSLSELVRLAIRAGALKD
jgi:hypothetical protein